MEPSNWLDYGILGLISVSVLMGLVRGFVREAISSVTWVLAIIIGILYCQPVAALFTSISIEFLRLFLAFVLLALTTLIIGGVLGYLLARLIHFTGFGITDRIIGVPFGFVRGAVVISLLVTIVEFTSFKDNTVWKESTWIPHFQPVSAWMRDQVKDKLPPDLLNKFSI